MGFNVIEDMAKPTAPIRFTDACFAHIDVTMDVLAMLPEVVVGGTPRPIHLPHPYVDAMGSSLDFHYHTEQSDTAGWSIQHAYLVKGLRISVLVETCNNGFYYLMGRIHVGDRYWHGIALGRLDAISHENVAIFVASIKSIVRTLAPLPEHDVQLAYRVQQGLEKGVGGSLPLN